MKHSFAAISLCLLLVTLSHADDWPQWRGPTGMGLATGETAPLHWSNEKNVLWKTKLPAPGNSTPIISKGKVFLTQASQNGNERSLICFDRTNGKELWRRTVTYDDKEPTHKTNPQAAASPTTDGETVIAWFGSAGVYAYDFEGKKLWSRDLGDFRHIWGYAASPVIYKDLVLMNCGPGLSAFLIALDKKTGDEVWRRDIPELVSEKVEQYHGSWSTPILVRGERDLMLLSAPKKLMAIDPATGDDIWHCDGLTDLVYTSPVTNGKIAVAMSGFHGADLAVRMGGSGDVTKTHKLWGHPKGKQIPQRVGTGVMIGDYVYIYNEPGIAWCIDAKTGETTWQKRLGGTGWTSMVHIGKHIYVINTDGKTFVIDPDPAECKVVAENDLDELTRGSIAVSNGQLFIRTYENLYCIGEE